MAISFQRGYTCLSNSALSPAEYHMKVRWVFIVTNKVNITAWRDAPVPRDRQPQYRGRHTRRGRPAPCPQPHPHATRTGRPTQRETTTGWHRREAPRRTLTPRGQGSTRRRRRTHSRRACRHWKRSRRRTRRKVRGSPLSQKYDRQGDIAGLDRCGVQSSCGSRRWAMRRS